jgi:shikimate dehydrogenase
MSHTGRTRIAGIMGWPVAHSRSPLLHGYWLQKYAIDGAYVPLPIRPEHFAQAFRALPLLGFAGGNITVPHKQAALANADRVDAVARRIGAVNAIVIDANGQIEGRNTDGLGFIGNLHAAQPGWQAARGPAVVCGAGGAARAVVVTLADAGVPEIRLVNRTAARAEELARGIGAGIRVVGWADRAAALDGVNLLVNTTSLGMTGQPALDLDLARLPTEAVVYDIVYVPRITPLLAAAMARGNPVVDGLGMLLHQARPAFLAWFGVEPEVTPDLVQLIRADIEAAAKK